MPVFLIRDGLPADAPVIAAFNAAMARETEALELDPVRLLAGVRAVFDDPAKGFYLVAEQDGEVIGQLMITYEWSDWRNGDLWWLQSVYVAPEHRRRGVFRRLFEHVLREAEANPGVVGVRLYVEDGNAPARDVYRRLGLRAGGYHVMERLFNRASAK